MHRSSRLRRASEFETWITDAAHIDERLFYRLRSMPKSKSPKFYGTRIGKDGPYVYRSWLECEKAVKGYPGARYKSFSSEQAALQWAFELEVDDLVKNDYNEGDVINISSDEDDEVEFVSFGAAHDNDRLPTESVSSERAASTVEDPMPSLFTSEKVVLSEQQEDVLRKVLNGRSVFFTGSAGTGKSVLLREIITQLRLSRKNVAVTASTGIAATNIGGCTLHYFAGIGLGKENTEKLIFKIRNGKEEVLERWLTTDVLVIDEISMIDGVLFDKLEELSRRLRQNKECFGGIQLVLCGDFFQLPPVPEWQNNISIPVTFAFDAKSWKKCVGEPIVLSRVFRQKEQRFVDILNALRIGEIDPQAELELMGLDRPIQYSDGIEPTELYPVRYQVQEANANRMKCLPEPTWTFSAHDVSGVDADGQRISFSVAQKLLSRVLAPKKLFLKIGAQVMLLKNDRKSRLVNGSRGVVVGFETSEEAKRSAMMTIEVENSPDPCARGHEGHEEKRKWPLVQFTDGQTLLCIPAEFTVDNHTGKPEATRVQVPLILAWALSIHKAQGQTIERLKIDLGKTFEKGQAYVALSRATSMDALQVLNFNVHKVMAHPRVIEWEKSSSQTMTRTNIIDISDDDMDDMDDEDGIKAYYDSFQ